MFSIINRIIRLSKARKWKIQTAMVLAFFEGIFSIAPEMLVMLTVYSMVNDQLDWNRAQLISILLVSSVLLRALFRRLIDGLQSGTGYEIFADERMKIGEHLKRLPMGFFTKGSIGDVTSIITTDILFVEMYGMSTISKIVTAYVSTFLGCVMMSLFDIRMGLVALATVIISGLSLRKMDKTAKVHSGERQAQMGTLVDTVIEFVKGIGVIKAFNLKGEQMKKVHETFKETRDVAIGFERTFGVRFLNFNSWFALGVSAVLLMSSWLVIHKQIDYTFGLMIMIYVFNFFAPFATPNK